MEGPRHGEGGSTVQNIGTTPVGMPPPCAPFSRQWQGPSPPHQIHSGGNQSKPNTG